MKTRMNPRMRPRMKKSPLFDNADRLSESAQAKAGSEADDLKCAGRCDTVGNPLYTVRDTVPPPPICVCETEAVSAATLERKPD